MLLPMQGQLLTGQQKSEPKMTAINAATSNGSKTMSSYRRQGAPVAGCQEQWRQWPDIRTRRAVAMAVRLTEIDGVSHR